MKVRLILVLLISLVLHGCGGIKVSDLNYIVKQIDSFEVYDTPGRGKVTQTYTEDYLEHKTHDSFDVQLFKAVAPFAKYKNRSAGWKGSSFGVIRLKNGEKYHVAISYYGGFFQIHGDDGYYVFDEPQKELWRNEYSRILQKVFIPKRVMRNSK